MTEDEQAGRARRNELRAKVLRKIQELAEVEARDAGDLAAISAGALAAAAGLCLLHQMDRTLFLSRADQLYRAVVAASPYSEELKAELLQ